MGLRFRKSLSLGKGLKLNVGKKSVGVSAGGKGFRYSVNSSGRKTKSISVPGTGVSYVSTSSGKKSSKGRNKKSRTQAQTKKASCFKSGCIVPTIIFCVFCVIFSFAVSNDDKEKSDTSSNNSLKKTATTFETDTKTSDLLEWYFAPKTISEETELKLTADKDFDISRITAQNFKISVSDEEVLDVQFKEVMDDSIKLIAIPKSNGECAVICSYGSVKTEPLYLTVKAPETTTTAVETSIEEQTEEPSQTFTTNQQTYLLNHESMKIHKPSCRTIKHPENFEETTDLDWALNDGYSYCGVCF